MPELDANLSFRPIAANDAEQKFSIHSSVRK
jgi:hypothetical protein